MVLVTLQSPSCMKPFIKAVNTLSKIGDEAFFEITEEAINLQSANSSTTAIVYFRFDRAFFSEYDTSIATVTRSQADKSVGYAVKLSSRCLANSLRLVGLGLTGNSAANTTAGNVGFDETSNKSSSALSVRYDSVTFECVHPVPNTMSQNNGSQPNKAEYVDDDLTIRLYSSNLDFGRSKTTTFKLRPLDTSEMMAADFAATTLRSSTNHLSTPAKKFSDLLANFATSDRNLLFCMAPNRFSLAADPLGKTGHWHRIGTDVGPASIFTKFEVTEEVNFGCILSELKTFLSYAVGLDWSPTLHIDFSHPGRPIVFSVEVADRLGFGDGTSSIQMGSLVLSTMTLPAGVSAAAANVAPAKTPAVKKKMEKNQPQIDTVFKSNNANRTARRGNNDDNDGVEVDLTRRTPSPVVHSSAEGRYQHHRQQPEIQTTCGTTAVSPTIPSRAVIAPSVDDVSVTHTGGGGGAMPGSINFLFAELFGGNANNRDDLMMSRDDVLAGDSDPDD